MTEQKSRISVQGSSTIRQRPSFLLMVHSLDCSAATLELALAQLRQKTEAAAHWLERLKAQNVEFGEPHFPEQTEPDPLTLARRSSAISHLRQPSTAKESVEKKVMVTVTALWPLDDMTSDEVLIFADGIQFEATDQAEDDTSRPDETPTWTDDIEQQAEAFMSSILEPPAENNQTQFLFVSRLSNEQRETATRAAFKDAQSTAEMLARAVGRQVGELDSVLSWNTDAPDAHLKRIQRQTYMPVLSETSYGSSSDETVSESPQTAAFVVTVNATYLLV